MRLGIPEQKFAARTRRAALRHRRHAGLPLRWLPTDTLMVAYAVAVLIFAILHFALAAGAS